MWTATGILLALVLGYILYERSLWREGICGVCGNTLEEDGVDTSGFIRLACKNCGSFILVEEILDEEEQV
jgi:DNA-directed RNA polymerase subunit RPC12/RpoP